MVCYPCGGAMCRDHAQYPAFAPGTSEVAVGLWPFCIVVHNHPDCHAFSCFESCKFLSFLLLHQLLLFRCRHSSKESLIPGPRLSYRFMVFYYMNVLQINFSTCDGISILFLFFINSIAIKAIVCTSLFTSQYLV